MVKYFNIVCTLLFSEYAVRKDDLRFHYGSIYNSKIYYILDITVHNRINNVDTQLLCVQSLWSI